MGEGGEDDTSGGGGETTTTDIKWQPVERDYYIEYHKYSHKPTMKKVSHHPLLPQATLKAAAKVCRSCI